MVKTSIQPEVQPLPSSKEAEVAVLGSLLQKGDEIYEKIATWIRETKAFYFTENRQVWVAIQSLWRDKEPIDTITVIERCKQLYKNKENKVSAYFITGLEDSVPTAQNAEYYAKIVWERHVQRETALSAHRLFDTSFDDYEEINKTLETHARLIEELREIHPTKKRDMASIVEEVEEEMKQANNIIQFGLDYLDWPAGGMTRKEITVLGGRPGHGKTTLMVNALKGLIEQGYSVMLFSREMGITELMKKIVTIESEILLYHRVRRGIYENGEDEELTKTLNNIKKKYKKLIIYDDVRKLDESIREIVRHKPDVVIDDYIQLIQVGDGKKDRRFEIEEIMYEYKWVCKKSGCSAMLVSQLNREIERRLDPTPRMSDYAESGVIEQTAETAMFVFYGYNFDPERYNQYQSQIINAKSRYGTINNYKMGFYGNKCKFYSTMQEAQNEASKHMKK